MGFLIRYFEIQSVRMFLDSEFTRKKTFKDSVFPLDLSTVSLLLSSDHNRDHCHFHIDLESITLALDFYYIKLLFSVMSHINKKGC